MYKWQEVKLRQIDLHYKLTGQHFEPMGVPGVANCWVTNLSSVFTLQQMGMAFGICCYSGTGLLYSWSVRKWKRMSYNCLFTDIISNYKSSVLTGLLAEITVHPLSDALCYLRYSTWHFPWARVTYKELTNNEQHRLVCWNWRVSASRGGNCPAPSLNMASKNLILTVKHWTKTPGPRHKANWNSVECCADCRLAKRSDWRAVSCQIK